MKKTGAGIVSTLVVCIVTALIVGCQSDQLVNPDGTVNLNSPRVKEIEATTGGQLKPTDRIPRTLAESQEFGRELKAEHDAMMKEFFDKHPDMKPEVKEAILRHDLLIGMSHDEAMYSLELGLPTHANTTTTQYGTHEQWIYDTSVTGKKYLYFDNGTLTSWQSGD